ncbi:MAG: dephospho-CoA kinase [Gemmataceae bacterium]
MNGGVAKPVLGLIGSIGAGKSTVARLLTERGGFLIDADKLGHDAIERPRVKTAVLQRWGTGVLKADGTIDRRSLGSLVFADGSQRKELEAILFPEIANMVAERIDVANRDPRARFIVLDAPVLIEAGWKDRCDELLFVDAPRAGRLERVASRNGWTEAELTAREAAQLPVEEKRKCAHDIIENAGTLDELRVAVDGFLNRWNAIVTNHKDEQRPKK